MPSFPYYGFTYPYYNNQSNYNFAHRNNTYEINKSSKEINTSCRNNTSKNECSTCQKMPNKSNNNSACNTENYLFNLFDIKLYFDDILILSLLFFLYKENVKDYSLFIALLFLLLN
jgi:hypothetical protein